MLQTTQAQCLMFRSARLAFLLPVGLSRDQPGSPSGSWARAIPALSQPPEIPSTAVATVGSFCSCLTLKALDCQVSFSHLPSLIRLCLFIILNASWRVLAPELSGQFCSSCSSMDKADQYPNWVGETILLLTLSELLLSLFSFLNYALKPLFLLILDFWWDFFSLVKENK